VSKLADYRDRREKRLEQTSALYQGDPARSCLLRYLSTAVDSIGADRAAILWVDEYGPGLVHVHCLLDLIGDPPRRDFGTRPWRGSLSAAVPGLYDMPHVVRGVESYLSPGVGSSCCIAMGSDGTRAWFLVLDSLTPRASLSVENSEALMFLAGESAAVVLHRDLDRAGDDRKVSNRTTPANDDNSFSGWSVLKDLEGREVSPEADRRITTRFLLARTVRAVLEEELTMDPAALAQQMEEIGKEISAVDVQDPERVGWGRVLDALGADQPTLLGSALLEVGSRVNEQGHLNGASEFFSLAYSVALICGSGTIAGEAARFLGRTHRRLGDWDQSGHWYGVARDLGEALDDGRLLALAMSGLGNNHRERGNLPAALRLHGEVLEGGREIGDPYVQGVAHHELMTDEKLGERYTHAIQHGWEAVRLYPAAQDQIGALTDLAWAFVEVGDLSAAEDAYMVVVHRTEEFMGRAYALDALAYIEALRGNGAQFEARLELVDALAWRQGTPFMVSELLFYRGKGYGLLGNLEEAERWLEEAMSFSEEHANHQISFQAQDLLRALRKGDLPTAAEVMVADSVELSDVDGVRAGLSLMRGEYVSA
jgi:tetratricopeptide (TPR) repeat protein